ncbi:La ribonucleoprotein [Dionaea muscipula]
MPANLNHQAKDDDEIEEQNRVIPFAAGMKVGVAENGAEGESAEEKEGVDEDEEGGDEDEEENEEVGEDAEEVGRPKLAEGFYEIEAIRKKRIFKGEPQYLIKWRGWPESSNTWEPLEHLQTCPDVVEAFEERRSGQKKTYRKRKRKFTPSKKKMQYSYGGSKSKAGSIELSLRDKVQSSDDVSNLNSANSEPSLPSTNGYAAECDGEIKEPTLLARKDNLDGPGFFHTVGSKDNNQNGDSEHGNMNINKFSVQFQQSISLDHDGSQISQSKVDNKEPNQSDRCTGAKRRKSGSVRRFKQDTSFDPTSPQNQRMIDITSYDRNVHQMVSWNNNFDFNASVITKIIKPIGYSSSASNNVHDVSVTFTALRADGKEVTVDNKFLKANNPLLLINFYEQHLRYSPTL